MLTYIQINAAKPRAKAWSLSDSQGLYLAIQPNGSKLWRFRYRFLDKQKTLHLGGWPTISLADARVRRDEAKKLVAVGVDPALEKKRARIAAKYAAANTFEAVAKEWLVKCERDGLAPVTIEKISWLLAKAYPVIGSVPIAQITPHEALAVLRKIEGQADRTVDAVARAHGGRYSVDLHLRHDPGASEVFATSHVRRLEAMRRAGAGPERQADGSWTIPHDHLDRAEAFARRQQRDRPVALSILSSRQLGDLAAIEAPTWLDRALAASTAEPIRDAGFGREVRTALAARRQWLIEQQLADGEGRAFRLRSGALDELGRREMRDFEVQQSQHIGKPFEPARKGERIKGVIARRVDLESGCYALVERSRDFTLVPWRDVLERNTGKSVSGIMRTDGIDWQFGRGRKGPEIN